MDKLLFFLFLFCFQEIVAQDIYVPQPKIWAVIIGISDYKDSNIPDLKFPEKDARAYNDFLQTPQGGKVPEENISLLTGTKATRSNILKALNEKFLRAGSEDLIIFYFSGHGIAGDLGGNGYLMSWDTEHENEAGTALEMDDIQKRVEKSKAKVKLNFIDACHAGLFQTANTKGDLSASNQQISQALMQAIASADAGSISFLASTARQQSLEDDKLGGGVFTHFLIKGLKGAADLAHPGTKGYKNGIVSIGEINTYISESVIKHTNHKQNPSLAGTDFDREFPLAILSTNASLSELIAKNKTSTNSSTTKGTDIKANRTSVSVAASNTNETDTRNYDPQAKAYNAAIISINTKACKDASSHWYGNYCFINRTGKPLVIYQVVGFQNYSSPIVLAIDEKICSYKLLVSGKNYENPEKPAQEEVDYEFKFQTIPEKEDDPVKYSVMKLTVTACKEKTIELTKARMFLTSKKL